MRLVREAVWYRGRCTWIGLDTAAAYARERPRPAHRSLGPGLADGTAGIALFLAQLHAADGDAQARRDRARRDRAGARPRRRAAGRRAVRRAPRRRLRRRALRGAARRRALGRRGRAGWPAPGAGAGPRPRPGSSTSSPARPARRGAARARARARRRPARRRRRAPGGRAARRRAHAPPAAAGPGRRRAPRRGTASAASAHGAAGAAWALLELFAVTGEARHRDGALRALDYERAWFDPGEAGWPDLRGVERSEPRGSFRSPHTDRLERTARPASR